MKAMNWPSDVTLFRMLVETAVNEQVKIKYRDRPCAGAKWRLLGRIDPTLRALFRAAGVNWP
jgi:N utilization substance protein B